MVAWGISPCARAQDQPSDLDELLGPSPESPAAEGQGTRQDGKQASESTSEPSAAPSEPAETSKGNPGDTDHPAPATQLETVDTIPVQSQEPEKSTEVTEQRSRPRSRMVEEIVVTAQKREENLQDVPISVQAFSAGMLDAKGIEDPKALALATPGMQYNVFTGYSLIYIRGVGTDAFIPSADASVATYIDNVYYPFGFALASALGAVERIEVLKGPQGTLFGRNSTGGAINILTRQPGQEAQVSLLADRENYDKLNLRAFVNIPLLESLAVSLSGLDYSERNYYTLSADSTRRPFPDESSRAFNGKARWSPFDKFSATFGYTYINPRGSQTMLLPAHDIKPAGVALGMTEQPDYVVGSDANAYLDSVAKVMTADLKYSAPWFDLRLIGGRQDIDSPALADQDGTARNVATFETNGQFAKVRTAELQVLSNDDSWHADWLKWIGGVYYINSSAGYDPLYFTGGANFLNILAHPSGQLSPLQQLSAPLIDLLSAAPGGLSHFLNDGFTLDLRGVLDTKSTAFFFQSTANITDWLALTLGGRYQTEKRVLAKSTTSILPDRNSPDQTIPVRDFGTPSADTSNFSPKAVLDFKFWEEDLLYASYSKGFKSGTFNIIAIYTPPQYIPPEVTETYELGYKSTWLDGAMRLNMAIFQNTLNNLQVQTISLTSGGAVRFETAGGARIRGADFDLTWEVMPETIPGLVLTAGGAYLDGVYTDYKKGSGFDETTGLFFDGTVFPARDFTGHQVVRTPKFSGNGGLSYTFPLWDGNVELAVDAYHNSGFFFSAQNNATTHEKPYTLYNARVSYLYEPWNLRVTAFGKNITDARYHYAVQELDFDTAKLLAPPKFYGVKLNYDF